MPSLRETLHQNNDNRYNNAIENRNKRVDNALVETKHKEFQHLLERGDGIAQDRAFKSSGMVARVFEDNPFTGFSNIHTRPESGIKTYEGLTAEALSQMPTHKVRQTMSNSNPHVSAAVTDFQEYVKPGWRIYPESHPIIDNWLDNMETNDNKTLDGVIDEMSESMFLHGAYAYESIFDNKNIPQRLAVLDPYSMVFTRSHNALGDFFELHQRQINAEGGIRSLHGDPTIEFRALYSQVANPYGKCLIDAALFHLIMVVEFFKSYKQVLQTLVWPALLMRVDRQMLYDTTNDKSSIQGVVDQVLTHLETELKQIGPGVVIAQGSEVMEPQILSGMNRATLGSVQDFIDILDRQIIIALKSNQLLFSKSDSFTESRAMYEMNHYALLINHAQKYINNSITRQMNYALQRNNVTNHMVEFRLDRSIFEEERLLAGINKIIQDANQSKYDAIQSLLMFLGEAELHGRMTKPQADEYFNKELKMIEEQVLLKRPY